MYFKISEVLEVLQVNIFGERGTGDFLQFNVFERQKPKTFKYIYKITYRVTIQIKILCLSEVDVMLKHFNQWSNAT